MSKYGSKLSERIKEHHAICVVKKIMALMWAATDHGGVWVSVGGGTANVLAGAVAQASGVSYEQAHHLLNVWGEREWYVTFHNANRGYENPRFDARTIAKAAVKALG
jgi:hypothetical protein